jgi:hypothetical protein
MGTTDKTARQVLSTTLRATGWDDWHDVLRAGDPSGFARALTVTALGASASYTQSGVDRFARTTLPDVQELGILLVDRVRGLVWADAAGTLYLEESDDNSAWTEITNVAVVASVTKELTWQSVTKRYYRFRYVNGAGAQTVFRLYQMVGSAGRQDMVVTGSNLTETPSHGSVTVTTTAAELFASGSALSGRKYIAIHNTGSVTVYIGGASVTTSNGVPVYPGDTVVRAIETGSTVAIYGIAASSNAVIVEEGK